MRPHRVINAGDDAFGSRGGHRRIGTWRRRTGGSVSETGIGRCLYLIKEGAREEGEVKGRPKQVTPVGCVEAQTKCGEEL